MTILELIVSALICAGLGFLGHLVLPRYSWLSISLVLSAPVVLMMLITSWRQMFIDIRKSWKKDSTK